MDITAYYARVAATHEAIIEAKKKGERNFDPDEASVWLVSQNQEETLGGVGGQNGRP